MVFAVKQKRHSGSPECRFETCRPSEHGRTGGAVYFYLLIVADGVEAAFGLTGTTVNTFVGDFVVVFAIGVDDGFRGAGANASTTELTFIGINLMHFSLL